MKVRIIRSIVDGEYVVTIRTEDFSSEENRWISEIGEPEIATGGTITIPEDDPVVMPETISTVVAGFKGAGMVKKFSSDAYDNPKAVALAWADTIKDRILEAMTDLKAGVDSDYRGETVDEPTYS